MSFDLKDYVEVADRIAEWYRRYPDGRVITDIVSHSDSQVVVRAAVFRGRKDLPVGTIYNTAEGAAGVGHSSLAIPGSTPYTKGSELENAETSAVGRALVMAGIPSKNVASANEVRAKKQSGGASGKGATTRSDAAPSPGPSVEGEGFLALGKWAAGTSSSTSSEPVGEGASGEGEPTPAGEDFIEKLDRVYTIAGGSAAKVMLFVKDRYPAWRPPDGDVGSVSDLKDWHLDSIIEDYG